LIYWATQLTSHGHTVKQKKSLCSTHEKYYTTLTMKESSAMSHYVSIKTAWSESFGMEKLYDIFQI